MPSNDDIFQSSFLNGLSMATAQESGKLAAMQQAAQLQYGLQSKQLDFQLSLLKMRESQAAQAVELRMAQDEHQLKLKEYALRAEVSRMNMQATAAKMEEEKVATAAGSLFEQYQAGMRNKGFLPNSPEEIQATDAALAAGGTFSDDARVNSRIVSTHTARKDALQRDAFSQGTAALKAIERSRSESRTDELGNTITERFYGESSLADLHLVAETFKRGADLGHEPSRQMYNRIQQDIASVGKASKPGVTPAASEAERARAAAGLGEARAIATQAAGPMSDEEYKRAFLSARTSTKQTNANRALDAASQKLIDLETRFGQADDLQAALGVKRLRDQLEGARRATIAGLQGRAAVDRASLVQSLTQDEVAQIAAATTEAEVLRLAAKFGARQIPAPEDNVSGFMTLY